MITRHDTPEGRFYTYNNHRGLSVNELLDKVQDKSGLTHWKRSLAKNSLSPQQAEYLANCSEEQRNILLLNRGEVLSKKIMSEAAEFGTAKHNLIEKYFTEPSSNLNWAQIIPRYYPFLQCLSPIAIEQKVFYYSHVYNYGYGGTFDNLSRVTSGTFVDYSTNDVIDLTNKCIIIDWKNTNKTKYLTGMTKAGVKYYPIIRYALQLACYSKAIKYMDNTQQLDGALIYLVPRDKVSTVYLYYFDTECLTWYMDAIEEILAHLVDGFGFNWNKFCTATDKAGYLGKRIKLIK